MHNARYACEIVRSGRLGKIRTVRINMPCSEDHHNAVRQLKNVPHTTPVPEGFNYDFWLGHTTDVPYTEKRCHFSWRFILAYGGVRVLSVSDVLQQTREGRAGEPTRVELVRGDESIVVLVPRGPLGVRLRPARLEPLPVRSS